ncbi:MAG: aspartate 1-decarboxylase [Planctomycetes bacterium]|nr:aspartate 1-decarboxylase [Planctomycetota bacterium]MBL7107520.1 aspartate 1-decarboxylase [Phycisphaerae bacterium]
MYIKFLKSKLHRIKVTDSQIEYPGSIGIDSELMEAADIAPYETVMIADVDNGSRLETYAVPAPAGSGDCVILGAAAHLVNKGDTIIIFSFQYLTKGEARGHKPKIVTFTEGNKIKEIA